MDFDFTDDQQALREAVRRWVDKGFAFERRPRLAQDGGFARPVYAELAGLGLAGLAIAEDQGGLGFGAIEAMVVCEELGRGLVNAPYVHGALVAPEEVRARPRKALTQRGVFREQAIQAARRRSPGEREVESTVAAHRERCVRDHLGGRRRVHAGRIGDDPEGRRGGRVSGGSHRRS